MKKEKIITALSEKELENISGGEKSSWDCFIGGFCQTAGHLTAVSIFGAIAITALYFINKKLNRF